MQRVLISEQFSEVRPEPVTSEEFANLLNAVLPHSAPLRMGIAVSGGPDSMALASCAKRWADAHSCAINAFIVDHALRPESAGEAEWAQNNLAKIGITAEILHWDHPRIATRLHDAARTARYRLMLDACKEHNIKHLLLAHQIEDQAETILMRFAKGSGMAGLAGMAFVSQRDGVQILRPFLHLSKKRLIATCEALRIPFINDASNASEKFARGRLRRVMPALEGEGLTVERLADLGARAAETNEALDHYAGALLRVATTMDAAGAIRLDLEHLRAAPRATALRALGVCLHTIHSEIYKPQHAALVRVCEALRSDDVLSSMTLHGCLIVKNGTRALIVRETAAIGETPALGAGEIVLWDGRWRVVSPDSGEGTWLVKPLGHPTHEAVDKLAPGLRNHMPQGRVRATLPSLWRDDRLELIPSLSPQTNHAWAQLLTLWPPDKCLASQ